MGQTMRSYYQVLGVPRSAPPEAIQQAYRKVIVRAACSSGPDSETLHDEVRCAREAFAVLMNPERRAAYDASCGALDARETRLPTPGLAPSWLRSAA